MGDFFLRNHEEQNYYYSKAAALGNEYAKYRLIEIEYSDLKYEIGHDKEFDDRVAYFRDQFMRVEKPLRENNPDLYNAILGNKKVVQKESLVHVSWMNEEYRNYIIFNDDIPYLKQIAEAHMKRSRYRFRVAAYPFYARLAYLGDKESILLMAEYYIVRCLETDCSVTEEYNIYHQFNIICNYANQGVSLAIKLKEKYINYMIFRQIRDLNVLFIVGPEELSEKCPSVISDADEFEKNVTVTRDFKLYKSIISNFGELTYTIDTDTVRELTTEVMWKLCTQLSMKKGITENGIYRVYVDSIGESYKTYYYVTDASAAILSWNLYDFFRSLHPTDDEWDSGFDESVHQANMAIQTEIFAKLLFNTGIADGMAKKTSGTSLLWNKAVLLSMKYKNSLDEKNSLEDMYALAKKIRLGILFT